MELKQIEEELLKQFDEKFGNLVVGRDYKGDPITMDNGLISPHIKSFIFQEYTEKIVKELETETAMDCAKHEKEAREDERKKIVEGIGEEVDKIIPKQSQKHTLEGDIEGKYYDIGFNKCRGIIKRNLFLLSSLIDKEK